MIRYALKCPKGHAFDSWFQSATAFDALVAAGHVNCVVCGSAQVSKAMMAPRVSAGEADAPAKAAPPNAPTAQNASAEAIAKMRRAVEANSTYVGGAFAKKAREMHEGTAPETSIYGEATGAEARALIEDGVPVLPLPFKPKQKMQ